jgi:hypothetical protein
MLSLFSLLLLLVYGLIILAHTWGFWRVYKSKIDDQVGFEMLGRGASAGLGGWFWLCFGLGVWNYNSNGGWMILIWIYGILFIPWIGVFLTAIFGWVINKLELEMGFWSRAFLGCSIGILLGIIIGFWLDSKSRYPGQNITNGMILLFGTMGLTSGIMADESELNDYRET